MTRRAKVESDPEVPTEERDQPTLDEIVPGPLPSDALPFNDVIDQRFRQLFTICTDPKDLTKALEAAVSWVKVRGEQDGMSRWGDALKGGTGRP